MLEGKIGLTKKEILSRFSTNSQLTINDLAEIIEANNQRIAEALSKATDVSGLVSQLQNLANLTNTQFK